MALAQPPGFGLRLIEGGKELCLAGTMLVNFLPMAVLQPLQPLCRLGVEALVVLRLHTKFDVGALTQRDLLHLEGVRTAG